MTFFRNVKFVAHLFYLVILLIVSLRLMQNITVLVSYQISSGKVIHTYCNIYNFKSKLTNSNNMNCSLTNFKNLALKFWNCKPNTQDKKKATYDGKACNAELVNEVLDMLKDLPNVGLTDITSESSCYGLPAAAMGHSVLVRLPKKKDLLNLHHSVIKNKLEDKITLLENVLIFNTSKPPNEEQKGMDKSVYSVLGNRKEKASGNTVQSLNRGYMEILCSDIVTVSPFAHTLMIVELGVNTHKYFDDNLPVLLSKMNVYAVFVQWKYMKMHTNKRQISTVEKVIWVMVSGQYQPWSLKSNGRAKLDINDWAIWPDYIVWILKPQ